MNLIIFLSTYLLLLFSIIGYGYVLNNYFFKLKNLNFGYLGFFGIFILLFISYISHIFFAHDKIFNSIILVFGLLFFVNLLLNINKEYKKKLLFQISFFILLIFFILSAKTHDDFAYYHFAYIHLITSEPTIYGIGIFNHGFRTPSSIFYLSSLFYLPKVGYDLIHIGPIFFLGFANFILVEKIDFLRKAKKNYFIILLSLIALIIINIFFYRMAEHGTDRSAQIIIFLIIIELLYFLNTKNIENTFLEKLYILIVLCISLKSLYVIYLLLFLPIFFYQTKKISYLINLVKNKVFIFSSLFVFLIFGFSVINTGCAIYPLSLSCFGDLPWSLSEHQVIKANNHYELWAKGGMAPNFKVENPLEHIKYFNWVSNWFDIYFFNKVSDYLYSLLFIIIFLMLLLKGKDKPSIEKRNYKFIYILLLIFFSEWFYNHPSLRYGGYHLIALIIFIPFCLFLENNINLRFFSEKITIILILIFVIFSARNLNRIDKEYNIYQYNIFKNPSYDKKFENYKMYRVVMNSKNMKTKKFMSREFLYYDK